MHFAKTLVIKVFTFHNELTIQCCELMLSMSCFITPVDFDLMQHCKNLKNDF